VFYQNLGNIGFMDINGNFQVHDPATIKPGPFLGIANGAYWTNIE